VSGLAVVIADDHPLFLRGLADVLKGAAGLEVIGEAADGERALALIESRRPRVAIVDVGMPGLGGLEVARAVRERQLGVDVVLLTMHDEPEILDRALELGVKGYVLKDTAVSDIVACVHYVAAGKTYISPGLSHHLVRRRAAPGATGRSDLDALTPVERRVVGLIARHLTTPQIAGELGIRTKTVENHRSNICKKLGVTGPNALVRWALQHRDRLI
jgi:DNA-binding NarL/FixJ family response regulator